MNRQTVIAAAAALVSASAGVTAQATPSFVGNWTLVSCTGCGDTTNVVGPPLYPSLPPGWGSDVSIEQDFATLAVINYSSLHELRTFYRLADPGPLVTTSGPDGFVLFVIRTYELRMTQSVPSWKGDTLVVPVTGTRDPGVSIDFTTTLVLDANGDLNVEWAIRHVRVNSGAVHIDEAMGQPSGFRGSDRITLKYRRI